LSQAGTKFEYITQIRRTLLYVKYKGVIKLVKFQIPVERILFE